MRAITLWQPWAWAFVHGKLVENRDWPGDLQHGEPVAIHASVKLDTELRNPASEDMAGFYGSQWQWPIGHDQPPAPDQFLRLRDKLGAVLVDETAHVLAGGDPAAVLGAVVAVATFDRRVTGRLPKTSSQGDWRTDSRYGWLFSRSDPLPFPVPCRGNQRIWHLPEPVNDRVVELWSRSLM